MFDWLVEDQCILKFVWWYTWFHPNEEETMNGNRRMKGVYSKYSSRSESINVRRSEYENRRSLYKSLLDELIVYIGNALNIDKHEKRVWGEGWEVWTINRVINPSLNRSDLCWSGFPSMFHQGIEFNVWTCLLFCRRYPWPAIENCKARRGDAPSSLVAIELPS